MLLPRVLTALVGIPAVLYLVHLGSAPFAALVVGVVVLALYEYGLILRLGGRGVQRVITAAGGGLLAAAVSLDAPGGWARGSLAGLVTTGLVLSVMLREMLRKEHSLDRAALSLFGAVFVGWTLAHLCLLRDLRPHGEALTAFLFVAVWAADVAAYAAGTAFGSRKLAPVISPRKTWEGAAAGLAAAIATALAFRGLWLAEAMSLRGALALGLIVGLLAQASDLAESVIKRAAGVKDSGSLLPGHGGVLDRFDSFFLTAPVLYYALTLGVRH